MRKVFYTTSILMVASLFIFPEKIYPKISYMIDKMNEKINVIENAVRKPILKLCAFQESRLACHLDLEDLPINNSCFVDGFLLKNKIKAGLPKWAEAQIKEDLLKFSKIHKKDLEKYFQENKSPENVLVKVEIKNKKVEMTYANERKSVFNKMGYVQGAGAIRHVLEYLANKNYIPDTVFVLSLADFYTPVVNHVVPIFVFCKDLDKPIEKDLILMPDWQNLGSSTDLRKRMRAASKEFIWDNKKNVLFWRGGKSDSTGFREKLVSFSKTYPALIDADFVKTYGYGKNEKFVTPERHLDYKYLISIDGHRGSWERLIWHLHSNSLIFKHQSNQVQWYYKGIAPWIDYVPVTSEESILERIRWAESHPKEVQSIIHHASNFVEQNLSLEDMYHYIAVLLQEYNKRLVD